VVTAVVAASYALLHVQDFANSTLLLCASDNSTANTSTCDTMLSSHAFAASNSKRFALLYHLFGLLWTSQFIMVRAPSSAAVSVLLKLARVNVCVGHGDHGCCRSGVTMVLHPGQARRAATVHVLACLWAHGSFSPRHCRVWVAAHRDCAVFPAHSRVSGPQVERTPGQIRAVPVFVVFPLWVRFWLWFQDRNKVVKVVFKLVQCCLWCFEKCVKFVS
jgi:hypothetical protein